MTLEEILLNNLNIYLQNFVAGSQQLHSILTGALSQYLDIILAALAAILPG